MPGVLEKRLKLRAVCAIRTYNGIPPVLSDFRGRKWNTPRRWKSFVKDLTEAIHERFFWYFPVMCNGKRAWGVPTRERFTEKYRCPNGTIKTFKRFLNVRNFYYYRYGRGGEFASGLYALLWHLGFDVKLVLSHWYRGSRGKHEVHVEVKNPWTRRWIPLDPAHPRGYGHVFPIKNRKEIKVHIK